MYMTIVFAVGIIYSFVLIKFCALIVYLHHAFVFVLYMSGFYRTSLFVHLHFLPILWIVILTLLICFVSVSF